MRRISRSSILTAALCTVAALLPATARAQGGSERPTKIGVPQIKIVGGGPAGLGENRWITSVQSNGGGHFCGGALIADRWVLTAAHCVTGENANQVQVWIGGHDLTQTGGGSTRGIERIVSHPDYDDNTLENDIALLELSQDAPAELPRVKLADTDVMNNAAAPGNLVTVSGWGALSEGGGSPNVLHEVQVAVVTNNTCNAPQAYNGDIVASMICAGFQGGGRDSCQGDSGGPLWVTYEDEDYQVGIVSFGEGCARPDKYGVYTRVFSFVDWIASETDGSGGGGSGGGSGGGGGTGGGGTGGSCAGVCGGDAGSCWCDSACDQYGDCCPDYQDQCTGGGGSGSCTETVCAQDPYCCEVEFDAICQDLAAQSCGGGSGSGGGGGSGSGGGQNCLQQVCAQDPYCCETEFDTICEEIQSQICS